jgi:class 3 adenylate cyclase
MIRKTIGDAVIVTWDGTNRCLSDHPRIFEALKEVVHYADHVAREIGCKGARAVLHHGQYFLGLVGTQTFGQIDVIGSGIDEVCKLEGQVKGLRVQGRPIKLAISSTATTQLEATNEPHMESLGFVRRDDESHLKIGLEFIFSAAEQSEDADHVA